MNGITVREAAKRKGCTKPFLHQAIRDGRLAVLQRFGSVIVLDPRAVDRLEKRRPGPKKGSKRVSGK